VRPSSRACGRACRAAYPPAGGLGHESAAWRDRAFAFKIAAAVLLALFLALWIDLPRPIGPSHRLHHHAAGATRSNAFYQVLDCLATRAELISRRGASHAFADKPFEALREGFARCPRR
jgi:hypothetical protein